MARGGLLSHAPAVLHDMAACIAEAVATVYLAEVRASSLNDWAPCCGTLSISWPAPGPLDLSSTKTLVERGGIEAFSVLICTAILCTSGCGRWTLCQPRDNLSRGFPVQARAGVAGAPSARDTDGLALLGNRAWPTYLNPRLLSTRALDRFRNQVSPHMSAVRVPTKPSDGLSVTCCVRAEPHSRRICGDLPKDAMQIAFEQWVRQGYWSVAAIFEDRHDVITLGPGGQLLRKSVPVKRTQVLQMVVPLKVSNSVPPYALPRQGCAKSRNNVFAVGLPFRVLRGRHGHNTGRIPRC